MKQYQYLDPAGTNEVINVLLELSDNAINNIITDTIEDGNNKIPHAKVTKETIDQLQLGIDRINTMIDDANISINNTKQFEKDTEIDVDNKLSIIEDEFDNKTIGVDYMQCYIVNCKYSEISNPDDNSIYIYLENGRYGLAYYSQGNWYVSGLIIPGIENLITKDELQFIPENQIQERVYIAYKKIVKT